MTRKDFQLIADTLRNASEVVDELALSTLADMFAEQLATTNPNFDKARFVKACEVSA
jgi:hypothetical protein